MNLPPLPFLPASPEQRIQLIAWGEECARMGAEAERLSFYSAQPSSEAATVRDAARYRLIRSELIIDKAVARDGSKGRMGWWLRWVGVGRGGTKKLTLDEVDGLIDAAIDAASGADRTEGRGE